jgi:glutathione reductase (NADPH)
MSSYDFLVIGGGSGGMASARRAAKDYGKRVCMVERWPYHLGGTCVNLGCVPKKVMYNTSFVGEILSYAEDYGYNIKHQGKFSDIFAWSTLVKKREAYIERLRGIYTNNLKKENVDLVYGTASFENANTVQVKAADGSVKSISADHILIATGGRAIIPQIPGADLGITSDGFFALADKPKKATVIGAGYIAVELAGILNGLGVETSLLCRHETVLRHFDNLIADNVHAEMAKSGVTMINHSRVMALEKQGNGITLKFSRSTPDGQTTQSEIFGNDCVIWAIGRSKDKLCFI